MNNHIKWTGKHLLRFLQLGERIWFFSSLTGWLLISFLVADDFKSKLDFSLLVFKREKRYRQYVNQHVIPYYSKKPVHFDFKKLKRNLSWNDDQWFSKECKKELQLFNWKKHNDLLGSQFSNSYASHWQGKED